MQIYLHIILPQLRLLLERLRLTFTFSQFSLGASMLNWMYWVPPRKVEVISVFLEKEPKHWNQFKPTESTRHPNIMMLHFSKKKHPFWFCFQKRWCFFGGGFNHPNGRWWREFIPKTEPGETPRFGSIIATSSSCPLMNSARRSSSRPQVPLVPTDPDSGSVMGIRAQKVKLLGLALCSRIRVEYPSSDLWMYRSGRPIGDWFVLETISRTIQI